ncbi:alpha/beta fold hydrolase [Aquimarina addita]|uniref:Alpha/beta fold hydrolase n=1 Tax=Aquimarina addita TaxID=870485 RepID=A0ABP7XBR8_9FLAO
MPVVPSLYKPPYLFRNNHFSTIYPNLIRKVKGVVHDRERVELIDDDFIDLDWSYAIDQNCSDLTIVIHGLEGNAQRHYMLGLIKQLNQSNRNVAAINLRNCSGEVNRQYKSYHAGASDDLDAIIQHILQKYSYTSITLVGFSLGGNLMLKYLGEKRLIPSQVMAAVAISVPCDLYNSLSEINKPHNYIYQKRFLTNLKAKLLERQKVFSDNINKEEINACRSLIDIDNLYTSVAHGYQDAIDYYTKCSSLQFLQNINIPTLILNAKNDSFLGESCYPIEKAEKNPNLFLEMPDYGGHVGFYLSGESYYSEYRTIDFLETYNSI